MLTFSNTNLVNDTIVQFYFSEKRISSRSVPVGDPIAFSAFTWQNQDNLGLEQIIKFPHVELNIGNSFHPASSVFIAPKAGIYLFSATVLSDGQSASELHATIAVNDRNICIAFGDARKYDQGSQTVVLQLRANDEVFVRVTGYSNVSVYGSTYSSFSGALLYEM